MKYITPIVLLLLITSCRSFKGPSQHGNSKHGTKTVTVASKKVACTGVAPQTCYLYKENADDEWIYFYGEIDGFEYEEGFEYVIKVKVKSEGNSYLDASDLHFILLEEISKVADSSKASGLYDSWGLLELNGQRVNIGQLEKSPMLDINTLKKKMMGSTGCNSFSTGFSYTEEGAFSVEFPFPMTQMACEPYSFEIEFLAALKSINAYKISGVDLIFYSKGVAVLKYRKVD